LENSEKQKPKPKQQVTKQSRSQMAWSLKILVLSFALSMCFGIVSELVLGVTGVVVAVLIIIVFVALSIITDMIGVATTSANAEPFRAMASKKVRGAKEALKLLSKADRVSSICCDVIGDVCGILSGAAGASIVVKFALQSSSALSVIIASLVSAIVASMTIFGKSICKKYAIDKSTSIVIKVGKVISWFTPQEKKDKKNSKQVKNISDKIDEENK
jgi:hypothetical protein